MPVQDGRSRNWYMFYQACVPNGTFTIVCFPFFVPLGTWYLVKHKKPHPQPLTSLIASQFSKGEGSNSQHLFCKLWPTISKPFLKYIKYFAFFPSQRHNFSKKFFYIWSCKTQDQLQCYKSIKTAFLLKLFPIYGYWACRNMVMSIIFRQYNTTTARV